MSNLLKDFIAAAIGGAVILGLALFFFNVVPFAAWLANYVGGM